MDITELNKLGGWEGSTALRSPTGLKGPERALVPTPDFYPPTHSWPKRAGREDGVASSMPV